MRNYSIFRLFAYFSVLIYMALTSGCISAATQDNKKIAQLKMDVGVSYLQQNNLPLALKELQSALELDPSNPYIHNNLGLVYFLREKYELSSKYFEQAVSLDSRFTEAKNNLARVYIEMNLYSKADDILKDVTSDLTYTNINSAYFNYGLMHFRLKKYEKAKDFFFKILSDNREDCYTQIYYGRSLLELKILKTAAEQFDKATQFCIPVKVDDAHYYAAIAYFRLGQKTKSLARFQELVKIFPEGKLNIKAQQMIELIEKGKR